MSLIFYSKSKNPDARYLSNFTIFEEGYLVIEPDIFSTPNNILKNKKFPSIEHAFQGYKLAISNASEKIIDDLIKTTDAKIVKQMGGKTFFKNNNLVLDIPKWNNMSDKFLRYLVRQRLHVDDKYKNIVQSCVKNNIKLYHFDRAGEKSRHGGYFQKSTGNWVGKNLLSKIIVEEYLLY